MAERRRKLLRQFNTQPRRLDGYGSAFSRHADRQAAAREGGAVHTDAAEAWARPPPKITNSKTAGPREFRGKFSVMSGNVHEASF
jgi:hypothetical protein